MLKASPITLVDLFTPVDRYSLFASLVYPHSLQQTFTSTRPIAPDSYLQDLDEFKLLYDERGAWFKDTLHTVVPGFSITGVISEYIAIPAGGGRPSQFCIVTSFQDPAAAASYRKHFYP